MSMGAALEPTDEELVDAFQRGETAAFERLVRRWERKIQGAIYRIVGPGEDVRDLCQEAFLKAYRGLPTFKREARFSSWLYQIALNTCRDRHRRRRGRTFVGLEELERGQSRTGDGGRSVAWMEARDLASRVSAAVAELPPEQRDVLILKEYEGLTFPEIAEALDVPVSTVKTRLYRGLQQLRVRLDRRGMDSSAGTDRPPLPA
jgi:RNA polymerase sigma-70 factor (ECF subfamily)